MPKPPASTSTAKAGDQRRDEVQTDQVQQFGQIVGERAVEIEDGIAQAGEQFRQPARIQHPVTHMMVERDQAQQVQRAVGRDR